MIQKSKLQIQPKKTKFISALRVHISKSLKTHRTVVFIQIIDNKTLCYCIVSNSIKLRDQSAFVSYVSRTLFSFVPHVLHALSDLVPYVPRTLS